ncbi:helix-turn-helix domain-containing protein [Actinoplanes sp. NPDC049668]|uniref:helix-turn-helix domain-containing protein n=1 Tax=unclassified Actinoplanes TaxID=2626549 RepID=UPI0033A67834
MSARYLSADEAAALLGRKVPAVYRLAHRHGWRRIVHHGRTYYHPGDVEHTIKALTR